jgi:hypothetical protein
MATLIHFDDEELHSDEFESMGIGIGHRDDIEEEPDNETMGIGIGHRDDSKEII